MFCGVGAVPNDKDEAPPGADVNGEFDAKLLFEYGFSGVIA